MATSPMSLVIQHLRTAALRAEGADLTDGQLLESFISRREPAALELLVRRHAPMVWGVCRRILRNHHDAEDAFQATFLVFVRKAGSVMPREMVGNWLYGVAHQTARKAKATRAKRRMREAQQMTMPEPAIVEPDLWNDLRPVLDRELSLLPDKYRAVIVLCDLEGKTRREAARQLGLPEGTIGSRLARARALLAKRLIQRGVTLSGGALATVLAQKAASAGVPTSVAPTIQAAGLLAAGTVATGAISVKVAALTEGVLQFMLLTKLKVATAMLLVVALGLAGVGAAGLLYRTQAGEPSKGTEGKERPAAKKDEEPMSDKERLPEEVERERKRLAGVWRLVGVEAGGKKATTEDMDQMVRMKLTHHFQNLGAKIPPNTDGAYLLVVYGRMGNWKEQSNHGTILAAGTSAINPTAEPKTVDWVVAGDAGEKAMTKRGIYEIRTEDSWRVCFAPPGEDRPDRFTTSTKDGRVIWVFQRVTGDEQKQPAAKQGDVNQKNAKPAPKHTEKAVPAPIGTAEKNSPKNAKKEPNVLTPEEAIKQMSKEKLTVQFKVTAVIVSPLEGPVAVGYNEGPHIRLLDGHEFSVLLLGPASYQVMRLGIDPAKHFSGKSVRITGRVLPDPYQIMRLDVDPPTVMENDKGPPFQILVDDLDHFEVVTE